MALLFGIAYLPGRLLVLDEQPQKADVIIVLAGDRGMRTERGVQLWHEGYAPYVMVSGGSVYHTTSIASLMMKHAIELGVPAKAIILEEEADSTYQNALYTKNLMKEYGFSSAIVVSSDYHMQRVRYVYQQVFKDTDIKFIYCASQDSNFNSDHWWINNRSMMITINEYIKFMGSMVGQGK